MHHPAVVGRDEYVEAGPNLILDPRDKQVSKADFMGEQFYDGAGYKEYLSEFVDRLVTWVKEMQGWKLKYDGAMFMVLSNMYHWWFVWINEAFARFYPRT